MTHEQMVAWLILEGWEYHPDEGDIAPHIIQNRRQIEDGYVRCAGRMAVYYGDKITCYTDGTSASLNYDATFSRATPAEVELFYAALNDPDKLWSYR